MLEPTLGERCVPSLLGDKYRLEREVGRGGMGVVYLATHIALEQAVAIKIVLPALAQNPVVIQRVLREARCAAQITGDHVVRVVDVGQLDSGQPFIVMEYVDGQDLARVLAERGRLPPPLAVHWLLEAAVAIAEAHQKGIVHRDLKPGNLLLARAADGRELIKVLDFGISKQLGIVGERPVTRANDVIGSPNYMAPEQIRTPLLVDARADLWSLGAILLEFLTGKRAFPGDTITAVYTRVLEGEPDLPESVGEELPADLRAIVLRCLRKDPNERFQSIHELVAALAPLAPARSASALQAIARRGDRTLAESALATRVPSRLRYAVIPGLLIGLMLSAAGAAWVGAPDRLLERLAPSPRGADAPASAVPSMGSAASSTPASPFASLVRPSHDAAAPSSSMTAIALPSAPSLLAAPIVTPIVATADAGLAQASTPVELERSTDSAALPLADDRSVTAEPAATHEDPRANRRPSDKPPERPEPALVAPAPVRRNPWDVSTFGGRS
jgi:serine/threonine protein kinase